MNLVTRRLVGFGGLFVGLVLVIALVGLFEHHTNEVADRADDDAHLVHVERGKVDKLSLDNANGGFVVVRSQGSWWLSEPIEGPADNAVVDGMVSALADLRRTRTIEDDGHAPDRDDLTMFGLSPPVATITVESGTDQQAVELGNKNDFNGELYARVRGSTEVVMVAASFDYQMSKTLFDLRDKRLVTLVPEAVSRVDVTRADGSSYLLERRGGQRFFVTSSGASSEADTAQVSGVLQAITGIRALAFATEKAATEDERTAYLSRPLLRVRLEAGDAGQTLIVAKREDGWYAGLEGDSPIIQIAGEALVRKVDVDPASLRDLRVMKFERADVAGLTLTGEERAVSAKMDDAGAWQITAAEPNDGGHFPREADGAHLSGVLYTLYSLQSEGVVAEASTDEERAALGFAKPLLTVSLARRDGTAIGTLQVTEDPQKRMLATLVGSGRIERVAATAVTEISTKLTDYLPNDATTSK